MILLTLYLLLAIGVSFLCSILEAVLLSITPSYIALQEQKNSAAGTILKELKEDIDRPLSAILSLNTIAHTVGAAGVGAQAAMVFGNSYVGVISAVLTFLILVFSEIIPKTLGATYWKKLSNFSARVIKVLMILMYPFVMLSKGITKLIARGDNGPGLSREEFSAMADKGVEEGIFEEGESTIFKNLIRFKSLKVRDIMTPRVVVIKFSENITVEKALESVDELYFTRIPVYGENEEDISGYVLKTDLYYELSKGNGDKELKEIRRAVHFIPQNISLKTLFEQLLEKQEHIAVVVDEYGGFSGVVTMEDVVETLLGMEIVDEIDAIEDMQKLARKQWRERARRLGIVSEEESRKLAGNNPPGRSAESESTS